MHDNISEKYIGIFIRQLFMSRICLYNTMTASATVSTHCLEISLIKSANKFIIKLKGE